MQGRSEPLNITIASGDQQQSFDQTFRAVPIEDRWVWVPSKSDAAAYKAGSCPSQ